MKITETDQSYAQRAALETLRWFRDRSGSCHPIAYERLSRVAELLSQYLEPAQGTCLRKLKKSEETRVLTLLEGFIFAKLKRS